MKSIVIPSMLAIDILLGLNPNNSLYHYISGEEHHIILVFFFQKCNNEESKTISKKCWKHPHDEEERLFTI